jgi:hypothetical protein
MGNVNQPGRDTSSIDTDHHPIVARDLLGPAREPTPDAVEVAAHVGNALVDTEPERTRTGDPHDLHLEFIQRVERLPIDLGKVQPRTGSQRAPREYEDGAVGARHEEESGDRERGEQAGNDRETAER